jgi:hypothetical protein
VQQKQEIIGKTAEEVLEQVSKWYRVRILPPGAKAPFVPTSYGTAEAVPFQNHSTIGNLL